MTLGKRLSIILAGFLTVFALALPSGAMAVDLVPNEICNKNNASSSAACDSGANSGNPLFGSGGILAIAINILTVIVGIAAVIMIMLAGLKFITSGSNPQEVTKAREMIIYAVVGLIIAALAQVLVRLFIALAS